jgi:hypothetical protein
MNPISHLNFARNILKRCRLDERAACFANIPAFISRGVFYNSMFTHALSHLPDMLEALGDVGSSLERHGNDVDATREELEPTIKSLQQEIRDARNFMQQYHYKKRLLFYRQILDASREIVAQYQRMSGEKTLPPARFYDDNQAAVFLAFAAYIYFDLWIGPRQLFFPQTSGCSGSWALWEDIDYFQVTEAFFGDSAGGDICSGLYDDKSWRETFDPFDMIKAMIIRMGEKGSPAIAYSIVDWNIRIFLRYLGVNEYKRGDAELGFLNRHEALLDALLREVYKKQ